MKKPILFLLTVLFLPAALWGQTGTIKGKVRSDDYEEGLAGAIVKMEQNGQLSGGAYADAYGDYVIKAQPGTYSLIAVYTTYMNDTVEVVVEEGKVIYQNFNMATEPQVNEVVITAKANQASSLALDTQKKNSVNSVDGVSTDLLARTGDNHVGAAVQRISGVTVEDGKYVYVRGLGDRYSKATINGALIPSLDPNRNAVQLDIIPANLIDNILVYKTFTPDLPADFSGGLVDVTTKDYPNKLSISLSAGLGYNPQANLIKDFLSYETGSKDGLGFDDGTRSIPDYITSLPAGIPSRTFDAEGEMPQAEAIGQASQAFQTGMNTRQVNSFLNQSYQFSIGNQYHVGKKNRPIGFIAGMSYRNSFKAYNGFTQSYDDAFDQYKIARWKNVGTSGGASGLNLEQESVTQYGSQNVIWGALAKLSFKPADKHDFSINYMHNQSGESAAMMLQGPLPREEEGLIFQQRNLTYQQRSLDAVQLEGNHIFGKMDDDKAAKIGPLKADWIVSYIRSTQDEPDLRFFANDYTQVGENKIYDIQANAYVLPTRYFRSLLEYNRDARLNFELPFKQWSGQIAKLKFGGAYTTKDRDFGEQQFRYERGSAAPTFNGNPDSYLAEENMGFLVDQFVIRGDTFSQIKYKNYLQDVSEARNQYTATQSIAAYYGMLTLPIAAKLETTFGVRMEQTNAITTSGDSTAAEGILNNKDFLPAFSLKYRLNEKTNLRGSYTRTLARPTFREFSSFASFDFGLNAIVIGNDKLQRAQIDNLDLRFEVYPQFGDLISVSAFYKKFTNPIEQVIVAQAANLEFTWVNIPEALVYGVEFELRKRLSFISEKLSNFQLGGNASFIHSQVEIDPQQYQQILAVDPARPATRPLFGQSPYAANAEFAYLNPAKGWQSSLSYAVFGPRLSAVGGINPDIYEQARGLVNFSLSKDFSLSTENSQKISLRFRANNLLNPYFRYTQTYLDTDYIFQNYQLGRTYSFTITYSL